MVKSTENVPVSVSVECRKASYYYIRIVQADNEEAISSPIWVN